MGFSAEFKGFQRKYRAGGLVDRIHAQFGHGSMGRNAPGSGLHENGPFVTNDRIIGTGFSHHERTGLSQSPALRTQVGRPFAALFFPRREHQLDPAPARQKTGQPDRG